MEGLRKTTENVRKCLISGGVAALQEELNSMELS
jgi:hypothetical protein